MATRRTKKSGSGSKSKKFRVNRHTLLGIVCGVLLLMELLGVAMILTGASYVTTIGVMDFVMIAAFSYAVYKTLVKRDKLTTLEWVALFILALFAILMFLIGVLIGVVIYATGGS